MTLTEAQTFYEAAKSAYLAALQAQQYQTGSNSKRMAELDKLKANLDYWDDKVASLSATAKPRKAFRITPRDL